MSMKPCPPGPKVGLLEGYLLATRRRDPLDFLLNVAREYGDIAHFQIGGRRIFLLNHPDYIKGAVTSHYEHFSKTRRGRQGRHFLGQGLITSEGQYHRQQRRLIRPAFYRPQLLTHAVVMVEQAVLFRERWQHGEALDFALEMKRLTLAIISKVLFDTRTEAEADEIGEAVTQVLSQFKPFGVPYGAWLGRLPLPGARRARRAEARLNAIIHAIIKEHRQSGRERDDMLSELMRAEDEEKRRMTDEQLRDEMMTLFLAGHESLANALAWTWYLLAQHPEVQAKLHAELDATLPSGPPTFADLRRLRYTGMVFAEAMRLYPPAWTLARFLTSDYEVGGYVLPAGAVVLLSQYVMHRDPRFFPDPTRFDPLRWTPEGIAERPAYSYFPFGAGVRRCLGDNFALLEGILLLATLAQRGRVRLGSSRAVEAEPVVTLRPKGGMMLLWEKREAPAVVSCQQRAAGGCRSTGRRADEPA
jgi:cytochrome P450